MSFLIGGFLGEVQASENLRTREVGGSGVGVSREVPLTHPRISAGRPAHVPPAASGAKWGGLPRGGGRAAAAGWGTLQPQDAQQAQEERGPTPGIELASPEAPGLSGRFFTTCVSWEAL